MLLFQGKQAGDSSKGFLVAIFVIKEANFRRIDLRVASDQLIKVSLFRMIFIFSFLSFIWEIEEREKKTGRRREEDRKMAKEKENRRGKNGEKDKRGQRKQAFLSKSSLEP